MYALSQLTDVLHFKNIVTILLQIYALSQLTDVLHRIIVTILLPMHALSQLTDFLHCSFQFKKAVSYAIYTNLYFDVDQIIFLNCVFLMLL